MPLWLGVGCSDEIPEIVLIVLSPHIFRIGLTCPDSRKNQSECIFSPKQRIRHEVDEEDDIRLVVIALPRWIGSGLGTFSLLLLPLSQLLRTGEGCCEGMEE